MEACLLEGRNLVDLEDQSLLEGRNRPVGQGLVEGQSLVEVAVGSHLEGQSLVEVAAGSYPVDRSQVGPAEDSRLVSQNRLDMQNQAGLVGTWQLGLGRND